MFDDLYIGAVVEAHFGNRQYTGVLVQFHPEEIPYKLAIHTSRVQLMGIRIDEVCAVLGTHIIGDLYMTATGELARLGFVCKR